MGDRFPGIDDLAAPCGDDEISPLFFPQGHQTIDLVLRAFPFELLLNTVDLFLFETGLDPRTGGAYVNEFLETNVRGIFSCGNVLHVNDYVDEVSNEGEIAARGAKNHIKGSPVGKKKEIALVGNKTIGQIVPQAISGQQPVTLCIRVKRPMEKLTLRIGAIFEKKIAYARPSEMIQIRLSKKILSELEPSTARLKVSCEER